MDAPFPLLRVSAADPRERGRIIGEETRDRIAESVSIYEETFAHYTGLDWDEIKAYATGYAAPIAAYDEAMLTELEGIAEGAGLGLDDLLAVNARSEIMFGLSTPGQPECTVFFAGGETTRDGHVLLGQNWDWRPRTAATVMIFEVDQGPDRPAYFTVAEAGVLAKTGFNEHGIGVTVNALISDHDLGERLLPMHAVVRGILNSRTIEEAVSAVIRARRGASVTYTVADANGTGIAIEAWPGGVEAVRLVHPADGLLFHTNHFTCPVPFRDVGIDAWADTVERLETIEGFLGSRRGSIDLDVAKQALSDEQNHPDSISRFANPKDHPVLQGATVTSVIMDLTAGRAEVTAGPPSVNEYVQMTPELFARPTVR